MLAHGPIFGWNPKGSPDFLAYPVPKPYPQAALCWYWGSEVLGCSTLRLDSLSSAALKMQPYPRFPGHVWPGHLPGACFLSSWVMSAGCPTGWFLVCRHPVLRHPTLIPALCGGFLCAGNAVGGVALAALYVRDVTGPLLPEVPCSPPAPLSRGAGLSLRLLGPFSRPGGWSPWWASGDRAYLPLLPP